MASQQQDLHVACMQLCSSDDVEQNLQTITQQLAQHDTKKLQLLVLPENATLISNNNSIKHQAAQKQSYQYILQTFSQLAKQHKLWLIAGSLLIQDEQHPSKYFNHCPVFSPDGRHVTAYNKIHLFDVDLGNETWQESATISPGGNTEAVVINQNWKVGLSICYDLRFPELYRQYSQQHCNIFTVPAAFTVPTGKAHWDILLKARAIENQSFVLAAGQSGQHADGRTTYGHSKIINPWGEVLAELTDGEGLIGVTLAYDLLQNLKKRMPILEHRRLS